FRNPRKARSGESVNRKVLLLAAVVVSAVVTMFQGNINPYYFQVIIYIGVNIILATSLNLINGYAGQFSLGHAGFMSLGAYTAALVSSVLPVSPGSPAGFLMLPAALLAGGVLAAVPGLLV